MINKGDKSLSTRYLGDKAIGYVYLGVNLIWQAISSCFGAGYWVNRFGWKNGDAWKN